MKSVKLEILKKNRKYFAAKVGNYPCKLIVDERSAEIEPGTHELLVEDRSVRTKYGTEIIYALAGNAPKKDDEHRSVVTLTHPYYNQLLVNECRNLGGRYVDGRWIFDSFVADKVEALDELYNGETVTIEITTNDEISTLCAPVTFRGYTLARAHGRDSGAKLGDGVAKLEGRIGSGGSMKNWRTEVSKGAVFRLEISKQLLESRTDDRYTVKVL